MKGAAVMILCAITLSKVSALTRAQCTGETEYNLLPHENCHQFYQCSGGNLIAQTCPGNLYFNPNTQQCDWPENVDCVNTDEDGSVDIDSPTEDTCKSDSVLLPHPNCNQFYMCDNGKLVEFYCPSNMFFNPQTEQCDYPQNVNCGPDTTSQPGNPDDSSSTPVPDKPTSTPEPDSSDNGDDDNQNNENDSNNDASSICAAHDSDVVLLPHRNCNQFYKCYQGTPIATTCPPKLLYNANTEQCDSPYNVDCGDRKRPRKVFSIEKEVIVKVGLKLKNKKQKH